VNWNDRSITRLIKSALEEDAAAADITTRTLIPQTVRIEALIRAKQRGVVSGLPLAKRIFQTLDRTIQFSMRTQDGARVIPGKVLARISGSARSILSGERTALNALQHLSGVATYTREQVDQLGHGRTRIYDTRKTLPGWRLLQKYAVACGGGTNHRGALNSGFLIKENHLYICRAADVDWIKALSRFRKNYPNVPVEIEVQTERDMRDVLHVRPEQVLLDNMGPRKLRDLIQRLRRNNSRTEIELSGGVQTSQLKTLGKLGADRISMGRLTHSAPAFDCSLDIGRVYHAR
jgi:nicotinate-nucleotide pyrophosphorylase (carboxylating)